MATVGTAAAAAAAAGGGGGAAVAARGGEAEEAAEEISLCRLLLWPRRRPVAPAAADRRAPRAPAPARGLRRVWIFGPHHSCTNALARELPRFFQVHVENNDSPESSPLWKHRVFSGSSLPALEVEDDVFCVCMVKDPAFWIQSLARDPAGGTFYDIMPIKPDNDERTRIVTPTRPPPRAAPSESGGSRRPRQHQSRSLAQMCNQKSCLQCQRAPSGQLLRLCQACARGLGMPASQADLLQRDLAERREAWARCLYGGGTWSCRQEAAAVWGGGEEEAGPLLSCSSWVLCPGRDLPVCRDMDEMDADDLEAVKRRAEELGSAGFSVWRGRAFLKARPAFGRDALVEDLDASPAGDAVLFCLQTRLEVGDFVRLSDDEREVREAFEAVEEAWDERLASALGQVFRVLSLPAPGIAGLPPPDGDRLGGCGGHGGFGGGGRGPWYFPAGVLRRIAFSSGELVRPRSDAAQWLRQLQSESFYHQAEAESFWWCAAGHDLEAALGRTCKVVEIPSPGVVEVVRVDDRRQVVLRLPAPALERESDILEEGDVVWLRGTPEAVKAAVEGAGATWGEGCPERLRAGHLVTGLPQPGAVSIAPVAAVAAASGGPGEAATGVAAAEWRLPAALVWKLPDLAYAPAWRPAFCDRPRETAQLFAPVLFDGVRYGDTVALWEATVASYFDEEVYPAQRTAVVRCEDFLFSFGEVLRALAARGLPLRRNAPLDGRLEPLAEPVKSRGHPRCTRAGRPELQEYYSDMENRHAGLTASMRARLGCARLADRLGYHDGPSATWLPPLTAEEGAETSDSDLDFFPGGW